MAFSYTSMVTLREKLGGTWNAVSVNPSEYDQFGQTPAVELIDIDKHAPTHFQSVPLSAKEAEAIRGSAEKLSGESPDVLDFQGGQKILRLSANAARAIISNENAQGARIESSQFRF